MAIAGSLVSSCLLFLSRIAESSQDGFIHQPSLRRVRGRLRVWANDFGIDGSQLDDALGHSAYLKEPTIILLLSLAGCLAGSFGQISDDDALRELNQTLQEAVEICGDMGGALNECHSEDSQGSAVEELHDILDSLYELSSALDAVLESLPTADLLKPLSISGFYERLIRDKFPTAPSYVISRFAGGISKTLEPEETAAVSSAASPSGVSFQVPKAGTITGGLRKYAATKSFHDSELGSSNYSLQPPVPSSSVSEVSSRSSTQGEVSIRMPPIPENAHSGFLCPICSRKQRPMYTLRQWKAHVFSDLAPYMCTVEGCPNGEQSFTSPEPWIRHQNSHRMPSGDIPTLDKCPFCAIEFGPGRTDQQRYKHIRKHMESIRLFALPPSLLISEEEDDQPLFDSSSSDATNQSDEATYLRESDQTTNLFEAQLKELGSFESDQLVNRWLPSEDKPPAESDPIAPEDVHVQSPESSDTTKFDPSQYIGRRYPLHHAAEYGLDNDIRQFLDSGIDVNQTNADEETALCLASEKGRYAVVRMLLDHGADVNAQGGHYGNALQAAAQNGNETVVRMLLDYGADVMHRAGSMVMLSRPLHTMEMRLLFVCCYIMVPTSVHKAGSMVMLSRPLHTMEMRLLFVCC
ncbi:hypothetical protein K440DRAFT_77236 [Wilcoxina mikolae CBS 423.85]|nr:hypothetical protein K440DRAFT_77236 [Wilcoxina mikolae CBS 423.85]